MLVDTSHRSTAPEIMDDFGMEGEILRDALDKIASINRLLGGNALTLQGVKELLSQTDGLEPAAEVRILDVGCGNGDMLRTLADFGQRNGRKFQLIGLDANAYTIEYARGLSQAYPNISYRCADIFEQLDGADQYDLILCTLTLHHFSDTDILRLLSAFGRQAQIGIVINDLQRSALAYSLFKVLCWVFRLNDLSREDGLVSILRGFKRKDLLAYAAQLKFKNSRIRWKWAFRYQWIIERK